jgi:hypothetical protein
LPGSPLSVRWVFEALADVVALMTAKACTAGLPC